MFIIGCKHSFITSNTYTAKGKLSNASSCFSNEEKEELIKSIYKLRWISFDPVLYIFPKVTNDSLCIGFYYYEGAKEKRNRNMVQYCVLKFSDKMIIHQNGKENYNKVQVNLFKEEYANLFTPIELERIETLFLQGTRRFYNDKDILK